MQATDKHKPAKKRLSGFIYCIASFSSLFLFSQTIIIQVPESFEFVIQNEYQVDYFVFHDMCTSEYISHLSHLGPILSLLL